MIEDWTVVYEADGDDLGSPMGILLYGKDVDLDDVDGFLNDNSEGQEYAEDLGGDFDAELCWVRKVPRRFGWEFVYTSAPGPGARRCVRIERAYVARHWCVNHPYEPYQTGFPVENFIDPPWPKVIDGYLHYCRACARKVSVRLDIARAEHMLDYYEQNNPAHAERARETLRARRADLAALDAMEVAAA